MKTHTCQLKRNIAIRINTPRSGLFTKAGWKKNDIGMHKCDLFLTKQFIFKAEILLCVVEIFIFWKCYGCLFRTKSDNFFDFYIRILEKSFYNLVLLQNNHLNFECKCRNFIIVIIEYKKKDIKCEYLRFLMYKLSFTYFLNIFSKDCKEQCSVSIYQSINLIYLSIYLSIYLLSSYLEMVVRSLLTSIKSMLLLRG